jgi:hypothetical protein
VNPSLSQKFAKFWLHEIDSRWIGNQYGIKLQAYYKRKQTLNTLRLVGIPLLSTDSTGKMLSLRNHLTVTDCNINTSSKLTGAMVTLRIYIW